MHKRAPAKSRASSATAKTTSTRPKSRPQWNDYLTDSSSYQLNQDQRLQKRIQMLTKIPTEFPPPRHPQAAPLAKSKQLNTSVLPPSRKPPVPRANPSAVQNNSSTIPRVNFDDDIRAFATTSTSSTSIAATEKQKQHLQNELDRMDVMLASLEQQADDISGAIEPTSPETNESINNPDNNTIDLTDTTIHPHDESMLASSAAAPAPPTSTIESDVVDLLHDLYAQLHVERQARERQDTEIRQLHETLQGVIQLNAGLRDDFNRAVKHIVKLKAVVVNLRHTVHDLEDSVASLSTPLHPLQRPDHHVNEPSSSVQLKAPPPQPSPLHHQTFVHSMDPPVQDKKTPAAHDAIASHTSRRASGDTAHNNQDTNDSPPALVVNHADGGRWEEEPVEVKTSTRQLRFHSRARLTTEGSRAERVHDAFHHYDHRTLTGSSEDDELRRRESVSIRHA